MSADEAAPAARYNPDVLSCLANLSSDEVFTPPELANQVLDLLPASLWRDANARFLDPCAKSGVFLREIARRLLDGLRDEIPDLRERINHVFRGQIYGISITALTAHLTRRTVYCSKRAAGPYSIVDGFDDDSGNIVFDRVEHTWRDGRCVFCGANEENYARGAELESHAYQFIHTGKPEEIFGKMKFDVIVGNPPYQLSDGGAQASAMPIYHKFIQQAKKMNPRYLTMIVPSRWFAGGRGMDDFRKEMLSDRRLRKIVDYFDSNDCFPGVDISGGICYFLWDRDTPGECEIESVLSGKKSSMHRPLLEPGNDTFIRFNEAVEIVRKIAVFKEKRFSEVVSPQKPFGLRTYVIGSPKRSENSVILFANRNVSKEPGYIDRKEVSENVQWIDKWKIYISAAYGERGAFPYCVLGKPLLGEPGSCCTETFQLVGPFEEKQTVENVISYITTRFFRFLVLLVKNTQHAPKRVYSFVPMQDFSEPWTDEKLYAKYGLAPDEIAFIESMVRPMEIEEGQI